MPLGNHLVAIVLQIQAGLNIEETVEAGVTPETIGLDRRPR